MKKQLHILKSGSDLLPLSIIETLSENHPEAIKVVLMQEGIKIKPAWKAKTYLLNDGNPLPSPFPEGIELIDYERFVDLIFEADGVVAW
jgi:hypothetical protein